ncbi:SNARE syntaxin16 [Acrasis kona]|uniref:SNARE syntaxin16 n=1 Tax=Acrasis kona TaxID=1008807 RepID=A0AAW2Z4L3_9EUKA
MTQLEFDVVFQDYTYEYTHARTAYNVKPTKHSMKRFQNKDYEEAYQESDDDESSRDIELGEMDTISQPKWVGSMRQVRSEMRKIQELLKTLKDLHTTHSKFKFKKDSSESEEGIINCTDELKRLFNSCRREIDRVQVLKPNNDQPPSQENIMKYNLKSSLATELSELTNEFRLEQQNYLKELQRVKEKRKQLTNFTIQTEELSAQERKGLEKMEFDQRQETSGFTEDQIRELEMNQKEIIRRDQDLRDILNDVVELQQLFTHFSSLVIEQGTMLDRIDYNVEKTHENTQSAVKILKEYEQKNLGNKLNYCIFILLFVFLLLLGMYAVKLW